MQRKQAWLYSCDFCKKKGRSSGHMKAHELSCTGNRERVCRMHKFYEAPQPPMADLMTAVTMNAPIQDRMKAVRELSSNCPMCILAAIRQSGICKWDGDPESTPLDTGFDFKKELADAWSTINAAKAEDDANRHEQYYAL